MDKLLGKINEAKIVLEKISKIEKSPTRLIREKKGEKTETTKMRMEELLSLQTLK